MLDKDADIAEICVCNIIFWGDILQNITFDDDIGGKLCPACVISFSLKRYLTKIPSWRHHCFYLCAISFFSEARVSVGKAGGVHAREHKSVLTLRTIWTEQCVTIWTEQCVTILREHYVTIWKMCNNLNRTYIYIYCSSVDSIHFSTREAAQAREQRSLLTLTRLWHLSAAFQQKITPRRLTP